jgi:hypothetical protein
VDDRPVVTTIDVAGLALQLEAESVDDLDLLRRVVGEATTDAPPEATLVIGTRGPEVPERPPDFHGPYGDHWDDGTTHSFRHHWGFTAEVTAPRAALGGPATGYRRWVTVRNSMLFVLARLLLARERFLLHGAAVGRDDRALLVVGASGTGKSSLAFAAHLAGWNVLGDDMVAVEQSGPDLVVRGIPRVPSIPADVAATAAVDGEPLPQDGRARMELTGFRLDPRPALIKGVVICGHDDGDGSLVAVTAPRALEALVPALVLSALPRPVSDWFPVAGRLARGPCTELRHATRPDERLRRAGELLDDAWRTAHH